MKTVSAMRFWIALIITGCACGDLLAGTAALLSSLDPSWLDRPGVHEVIDPATQEQYFIATGAAALTAKLPRTTVERILVVRARMDAVRRVMGHQHGSALQGNVIIEGQPRGVLVLNQQPDANDTGTILVTIAVPSAAVNEVVARAMPARAVTSQPAATQPAAVVSTPTPDTAAAKLARTAGLLTGTIRDALVTGPVALVRQAREALEAEDLAKANELIQRLDRISAGRAFVSVLREEMALRRDLREDMGSSRECIALARWASGEHRLHAVVRPLERSVATMIRNAGDAAFVEEPEVFFWLGTSAQAASLWGLAERAYALAVEFGVGQDFYDDARTQLVLVRERLANLENTR